MHAQRVPGIADEFDHSSSLMLPHFGDRNNSNQKNSLRASVHSAGPEAFNGDKRTATFRNGSLDSFAAVSIHLPYASLTVRAVHLYIYGGGCMHPQVRSRKALFRLYSRENPSSAPLSSELLLCGRRETILPDQVSQVRSSAFVEGRSQPTKKFAG